MKSCPIVEAIAEIRGGGYIDEDPSKIVRIWGGGEYVNDAVSYYVISRKIELARFLLSKPTNEQCAIKARELFTAQNTNQVIEAAVEKLEKKYIHSQFVDVVNLLADLESAIMFRVRTLNGSKLNISLPSLTLPPDANKFITNPTVLHIITNKIIQYINTLNINSIATADLKPIAEMPAFVAIYPKTELVTGFDIATDIPKLMIQRMAQETEIIRWVLALEKYNTTAINKLADVAENCQKIISVLT